MIKKRYHFDVIDSTNKKAKELALNGATNGTLVTADAQEAGVGRRGRTWSSEKGAGIYMSMVLRPQLKTEEVSTITLVAAMAVAKAIQNLTKDSDSEILIKWPNDVVMNKKKVCGILTELSLNQKQIDYVIVGIGINVTNQVFPEEIKKTASSILVESGLEIDKEVLITEVWNQFDVYFHQFMQTKDLRLFREEYENLLANKDRQVKVLNPAGEYTGVAKGITNKGELIVNTEDGMKEVSSGEVSVRGIYGYV